MFELLPSKLRRPSLGLRAPAFEEILGLIERRVHRIGPGQRVGLDRRGHVPRRGQRRARRQRSGRSDFLAIAIPASSAPCGVAATSCVTPIRSDSSALQ